jgi:hypothetical protein
MMAVELPDIKPFMEMLLCILGDSVDLSASSTFEYTHSLTTRHNVIHMQITWLPGLRVIT